MPSTPQFSAVNRFGLGARAGEVAEVGDDPRGWLLDQLRPTPMPHGYAGLPSSLELLRIRAGLVQGALQARQADTDRAAVSRAAAPTGEGAQAPSSRRRDARAMPEDRRAGARTLVREIVREIGLRHAHAATTALPFQERLVRFWSNHFAVSADKNAARSQAAPMEREAIRPHVLGHFADLLLAVETHPAMLLYLDNVASVGEGSRLAGAAERRAARRARKAAAGIDDETGIEDTPPPRPVRIPGLNENLAREILELHTLGVDGGYRQDDVRELARAISGWGTPGPRQLAGAEHAHAEHAFVFRAAAHEPGARTVLGRRYAEDGLEQGQAILRDLALHPSTARHLSLKLARHFVADAPPPALVERMAAAYLRSGGALPALYRAMVSDDAAWSAQARKFRTPDDFVVAAMRAGDLTLGEDPRGLLRLLDGLGQPVFTPRSPAGFPDTTADWATGDALRKRVQAASALAARMRSPLLPVELARRTVGAADGDLAALLRRAGSPQEGYALLFASPAFQWRV